MKHVPTWCCENIFSIDFNLLKNNNIKYILTDLDNTLVPYNVSLPTQEVKELISQLQNSGFNIIIVSNNTAKRVQLFAKELNIPLISGAKKPFVFEIMKYLKKHCIDISECVLIGDQIMTDIKCANKLKCKCILTSPLIKKESLVTYINRRIDMHLRKKYDLNNKCERIDRRG